MASHSTSEKSATVDGACLCGEVQFEITLPTDFCAHCHCTMCRRSHGAGYVTWVGVAKPRLRIVSGKQSLVAYQSSEHGQRSFCKRCGSTLIFESTNYPDQYHLPLGNLNGKIDRDPEIHVFFDHRAEWVVVGDQLPRFGGETGMEPL